MSLSERIRIIVQLGNYLSEGSEELKSVSQKAFEKNKWFTKEFIDYSFKCIAEYYLDEDKLKE